MALHLTRILCLEQLQLFHRSFVAAVNTNNNFQSNNFSTISSGSGGSGVNGRSGVSGISGISGGNRSRSGRSDNFLLKRSTTFLEAGNLTEARQKSTIPTEEEKLNPATLYYNQLMNDIGQYRKEVVQHDLFKEVRSIDSLKVFMQNHSFAVYDFMSLLKSLQKRFTKLSSLWTPPKNRLAARLINEIVLGEETDEISEGVTMSHYDLYMSAMQQVGADISPVLAFTDQLEISGEPQRAFEAAAKAGASKYSLKFVEETFKYSLNDQLKDVELASYFLFGREDPIPDMFRSILKEVPSMYNKSDFVLYLDRHIHIDEEEHGPMARRLLESLCVDDADKWKLCKDTAIVALQSRKRLWDGTLEEVREKLIPA